MWVSEHLMPIALWVTMFHWEVIEPEAEVVGSERVRSDKVSVQSIHPGP